MHAIPHGQRLGPAMRSEQHQQLHTRLVLLWCTGAVLAAAIAAATVAA